MKNSKQLLLHLLHLCFLIKDQLLLGIGFSQLNYNLSMLFTKYENLMKDEPLFCDRQELTLLGFPPVPASKSTQNWQQFISSLLPPIFLRNSSISIVSSNSSLMIYIKFSFDTYPSLLPYPPSATNASKYSSASFSYSFCNSNSLRQVRARSRVGNSIFEQFFSSRNAFN